MMIRVFLAAQQERTIGYLLLANVGSWHRQYSAIHYCSYFFPSSQLHIILYEIIRGAAVDKLSVYSSQDGDPYHHLHLKAIELERKDETLVVAPTTARQVGRYLDNNRLGKQQLVFLANKVYYKMKTTTTYLIPAGGELG